MTNLSKEQRLQQRLTDFFRPGLLEIKNQSHLHAGHGGDDGSGESHFAISIASSKLDGLSRVAQHRLIYEAIGKELVADIHAIQINIRRCGDEK